MLLVTGATGRLGKLVVERLAERDDLIAGTRTPQDAAPGVRTRRIDFDDPASLTDGFAGVETLLLISAGYGEDDVVIARHEAAITAAERAGVDHIVYTSLTAAGDHLTYALAHRWTERRLIAGTVPWTILRNGLYAELLGWLTTPDPDRTITAPLGEGRLAAVAREDLADVAALVAADPSAHAGRTYDLVGDRSIGGAELADALTASTGTHVVYQPGTLAEARTAIAASGAKEFQVPMLASTYSTIAGGFLSGTGGELAGLLGREPRSALDVITGSASVAAA